MSGVRTAPLALALVVACAPTPPELSLVEERAFLGNRTEVLQLEAGTGALLVAPSFEGRVLTAAVAPEGEALGQVVRAAVSARVEREDPDAAVGGLEALWFRPQPEAAALPLPPGRFALLGEPAPGEPLRMRRELELETAAGVFAFELTREVAPLELADAEELLGDALPADAAWTGWRSTWTVRNTGAAAWEPGAAPALVLAAHQLPGGSAWALLPDPAAEGGAQVFRLDGAADGVALAPAGERLASWNPSTGVYALVVDGPDPGPRAARNRLGGGVLQSGSGPLELSPGEASRHRHSVLLVRPALRADLDDLVRASLGIAWASARARMR